jgi:hypothetical protein
MQFKSNFKLAYFFCLFFYVGIACAQVQAEGEPIKAPDEVPLGGFEGCSVQPPKNNCQARIKCYGVGAIYGNSPFAVQNATKEAQIKARAQLAKFYNERVKAKDSLANAMESSAQSSANGGADVKETNTRTMAEVFQTSSEAVISGFQVLGRQVDMTQRTVTIKGGVSCKSQSAAAQSQAASARSSSPNSLGAQLPAQQESSGAASFNVGPTNMKSMNQKMKNADDF